MKKSLRLVSFMMILAIVVSIFAVPASAATPSEAKESVVFVESYFKNYYSNYAYYDDATGKYTGGYVEDQAFRGSGFAIGKPGEAVSYIVTNAHVVTDDLDGKADEVTVWFSGAANKRMTAQIFRLDTVRDICVLRLPEPTTERKAMVLCKSTDINIDDSFSALGYPGIADAGVDFKTYDTSDITITKGGISKQTYNDKVVSVYMIDIDIAAGNSGGPLVNSKGEVVGINTYSWTDYSTGAHANWAVTIDELIKIIDRNEIPYVLSTDVNVDPLVIILIAAAVVLVVVIVVVVILVVKKGKKNGGAKKAPKQQSVQAPSGAVVVGIKGTMAGRSFQISDMLLIGRNADNCQICYPVNTHGISGVHCEIRRSDSGFLIVDRGSSYGTFLGNGQRLIAEVPSKINSDEFFYLGSSEQLFQIKY